MTNFLYFSLVVFSPTFFSFRSRRNAYIRILRDVEVGVGEAVYIGCYTTVAALDELYLCLHVHHLFLFF